MSGEVSPPEVWRARERHLGLLAEFVESNLAEGAIQPIDSDRVRGMVEGILQDGIIGVIGRPDRIEASIGVVIGHLPYTKQPHFRVPWFGVGREWRGSGHAAKLMAFARWFYEGVQTTGSDPVPFLFEVPMNARVMGKLGMVRHEAPQVGAIFAWGAPQDMQVVYPRRRPGASRDAVVAK